MKPTLYKALILGSVLSSTAQGASDKPLYAPMLALQTEGDLPPAIEREVIEELSAALVTGVTDVLAQNVYGTGEDFAAGAATTQPVMTMARGLQSVGAILDARLKLLGPRLKAVAPEATWSFNAEILWRDRTRALPTGRQVFPTPALQGLLAGLQFLNLSPVVNDAMASPFFDIVTMPAVDVSQNPDQLQSLYDGGGDVYEWLADGHQTEWLPYLIRVEIAVVRGEPQLHVTALIKPGDHYQYLNQARDSVRVKEFAYQPIFFSTPQPALLRVTLKRNYQESGYVDQDLALTFGYRATDDMRSFATCERRCADFLWRLPTIKAYLKPSQLYKRPATERPSRRGEALDYLESHYGRDVDIFVLLKELHLRTTSDDPLSIEIDPVRSRTPLVLRRRSWLGNYKYTLIDESADVWNLKIYDRLVRTQVAEGLTAEVRAQLRAWGF